MEISKLSTCSDLRPSSKNFQGHTDTSFDYARKLTNQNTDSSLIGYFFSMTMFLTLTCIV